VSGPPTKGPIEYPTTRQIAGFHFLPVTDNHGRRFTQLALGLVLFGIAVAWTVEAMLGASPWTVFHEGAADQIGISFGQTVTVVGIVLLGALWILKEPLGFGTIANVLVIGPIADVTLAVVPDLSNIAVQIALLAGAPVLLGVGSGLYLGAGVGPGPRDGIMTALNRRGIATWKARTAIELTALAVGIVLGGTAGIGTVWMAVAVGPCVQFFIPWFRIESS